MGLMSVCVYIYIYIYIYIARERERQLAISLHIPIEEMVLGRDGEKAAVCKPGRECSRKTESARMLIFDFFSPQF